MGIGFIESCQSCARAEKARVKEAEVAKIDLDRRGLLICPLIRKLFFQLWHSCDTTL